MDTLDDAHKIAVGDRISFRIVQDRDEPKSLLVTDSGEIEIPYLGRFPARDKTCKQLAYELKFELDKDYYHNSTVILGLDALSKSRGKVYLVGKVRMPGPQEIPSDEVFTLSKAIMRAGGVADFADDKRVKVTRRSSSNPADNKIITVNLNEIIEKGKTENDLRLEPDDLIFVPSRLFNF